LQPPASLRREESFRARVLLGVGEAQPPGYGEGDWLLVSERRRSMATAMFEFDGEFSAAIGIPVLVQCWFILDGVRIRCHGIISIVSSALLSVLAGIQPTAKTSETEREYTRGGAQPEDPQRAAQGAPLSTSSPTKSDRSLVGYGFVQLCFLFVADVAARLTSLKRIILDLTHSCSVHQRAVAVRDGCRINRRWTGSQISLIQRGWNATRVRQFFLVGGTSVGLCIFGVLTRIRPRVR